MGVSFSLPTYAGMSDDPVLTKFMLDKLEVGASGGSNPITWESDIWVGQDLNKLWFKTEGERVSGTTEGSRNQLVFSRAVAPFWDFQVGYRQDTAPGETRDYATVGFQGVAPYYFESDISLSYGQKDQLAINANFEYEMMLTQKLVLSPEIEVDIYSKDDDEMGIRSGISSLEAGIRLRYEIKREFAPYIGVNWSQKLGGTADLARSEGEDASETMFVVGIRAWY